MTWRVARASTIGTSHIKHESRCQDASLTRIVEGEHGSALICVVSDGAGSAARSDEGALLACECITKSAERWWRTVPVTLPTHQALTDWVFDATAAITEVAERELTTPREFACTLVAAILCPLGAAYVQVGDGGIVVAHGEGFQPVFWPEESEAANLTYFITDEAWWEHLQARCDATMPTSVALFSDGLQLLLLDFASRSAHAPFFHRLFEQVQACPEEQLESMSGALAKYLNSDVVNSRTDDDKTLVLAVMS